MSCELSDAWMYAAAFPTLLSVMCAQPNLVMALRHFSALLHAFNQKYTDGKDVSLVIHACSCLGSCSGAKKVCIYINNKTHVARLSAL